MVGPGRIRAAQSIPQAVMSKPTGTKLGGRPSSCRRLEYGGRRQGEIHGPAVDDRPVAAGVRTRSTALGTSGVALFCDAVMRCSAASTPRQPPSAAAAPGEHCARRQTLVTPLAA